MNTINFRILFSVFFLFLSGFSFSQKEYTDSLWEVYHSKKYPDTVRHWALADLAWEYCYINPDSARKLAEKQIKFAGGKEYRIKFITDANNTIGNSYMTQGYYDSALIFFAKNEKIQRERNNLNGLISTYTNTAECYRNQGNYPMALRYSNKALEVIEKSSKSVKDRAILHNNIGAIYSEMDEDKMALKEYYIAAKYFKQLKINRELANVWNNISICENNLKHYEKAMNFAKKSIRLRTQMKDSIQMANSFQHIATLFYELNLLDSADFYIQKSISLNRSQNSIDGLSGALSYAGKISNAKGQADFAIKYCLESYNLSKKQSIQTYIHVSCECLYDAYKTKGNTREALFYFEEAAKIKDTLNDGERNRQIARLSVQYEFDKERSEDSIQNAQIKKIKDAEINAQKSQLKQEETLRFALYIGLALVLIFGIFIYNRFMVTKRQKKIIEKQKEEVEFQKEIVEEKNKEILDSINYAKRLQDAILPPVKLVKQYLPESFILYKPKDIVAGDFYFMEPLEDKIVFAAADCTGHGVPGAMVSVVCANAMNRAVKEFGITDPAKILDKVRELVVSTFEKSEDEVKDGMDISLCVFDFNTNRIVWSGANNPIWIIRKDSLVIEEIKPDKQPIGKTFNPLPFSSHAIQLNKGDSIYIFTDGFEDQFGGDKGKKFKSSKMKDLFLSIQALTMDEQRLHILKIFEEWKGELEQVDDVCIIGIQI